MRIIIVDAGIDAISTVNGINSENDENNNRDEKGELKCSQAKKYFLLNDGRCR